MSRPAVGMRWRREFVGLGVAAAAAVAASACAAPAVGAEDWRTFTSSRQLDGEQRLRVELRYGAGVLSIEPGDAGVLYHGVMSYDASIIEPLADYANGRLRIGVETITRFRGRRDMEPSRLDLKLGPAVPLDLDLKFGAGQAEAELGGLRLSRAEIATGASETTIRFSSPNAERMSELDMKAGAAALRVHGIGNASPRRLSLSGGVGDITLDFSGAWRDSLSGDISMGVGSLTLRLPRGAGVRITHRGVLSAFDSQGLTRRGDAYYSANWDRAEHRLDLNVRSAIGSVDIRWVDETVAATAI